jgi:hypothetical protein
VWSKPLKVGVLSGLLVVSCFRWFRLSVQPTPVGSPCGFRLAGCGRWNQTWRRSFRRSTSGAARPPSRNRFGGPGGRSVEPVVCRGRFGDPSLRRSLRVRSLQGSLRWSAPAKVVSAAGAAAGSSVGARRFGGGARSSGMVSGSFNTTRGQAPETAYGCTGGAKL